MGVMLFGSLGLAVTGFLVFAAAWLRASLSWPREVRLHGRTVDQWIRSWGCCRAVGILEDSALVLRNDVRSELGCLQFRFAMPT